MIDPERKKASQAGPKRIIIKRQIKETKKQVRDREQELSR